MFGIAIADVSLGELFGIVDQRIEAGASGYIVTPNIDHICVLRQNTQLRRAYEDAFLALPDGMAVMWAARLLGRPLRQKLSGSDLVPWLAEHASKQGHRVFFFGAAPGVAEEAARKLEARFPELEVAGAYSPPLGFEQDPALNKAAIERVRKAQPDICFIALGSPKQEIWMHEHYSALDVPVCLGIGAAIDFAAGKVRRAPVILQRSGLEWLWRLCQEPRRLWRRYLVQDLRFIPIFLREFRKKWLQRV